MQVAHNSLALFMEDAAALDATELNLPRMPGQLLTGHVRTFACLYTGFCVYVSVLSLLSGPAIRHVGACMLPSCCLTHIGQKFGCCCYVTS